MWLCSNLILPHRAYSGFCCVQGRSEVYWVQNGRLGSNLWPLSSQVTPWSLSLKHTVPWGCLVKERICGVENNQCCAASLVYFKNRTSKAHQSRRREVATVIDHSWKLPTLLWIEPFSPHCRQPAELLPYLSSDPLLTTE
jgi:hypothetical protein